MAQLGEIATVKRLKIDTDLVKQVERSQSIVKDKIASRTQAEIDALPTEQRWAEYGRTYAEEQEYRRTHNQNPDGSYKESGLNKTLGDIVKVGLGLGAAVITLGIAAPAIFSGASAAVVGGAAIPEVVTATAAPSILATVAAAAPEVGTILTATKGVSLLGNIISKASSIVSTVAESAAVQKIAAGAVNSFVTDLTAGKPVTVQQAAAAAVNQPTQNIPSFQQFQDQVTQSAKDILTGVKNQAKEELVGKSDNTLLYVGLGFAALMLAMNSKR